MDKKKFNELIASQPIVRDFDTFIAHLTDHKTHITNTAKLPPKVCKALNDKMFFKKADADPKTHHHRYPLLHLLYFLALDGKLFSLEEGSEKTMFLPISERLNAYKKLSPVERYFFIIQTLWSDTDWGTLAGKELRKSNEDAVMEALSIIGHLEAEKEYDLKEIKYIQNDLFYFNDYFTYFGWWNVNLLRGEENSYIIRKFMPTALGISLMGRLAERRDVFIWNKITQEYPFGNEADMQKSKKRREQTKAENTPSKSSFIEAFKDLLAPNSLNNSLELPKQRPRDGKYVFKVAYDAKTWRKIEISAQHSLEDLHLAIQNAFDFDNEHSYSFFMDNKRWSEKAFHSPESPDAPYANDVKLIDLNLRDKAKFLYLFDYADEWVFHLTLTEVDEKDDIEAFVAKVIELQGDAPKQYARWEEKQEEEAEAEESEEDENKDEKPEQHYYMSHHDDDEW
jgi:Plasmid pRiA4b ORF-3-like protein